METIRNLVTVDLDESAQAEAVTEALLETLDRSQTRATFFMPQLFAEKHRALARRVAESGHEVACLTVSEPARAKPYCSRFSGELEATRDAIEQVTGQRVRGHRNARLAVDYESEWTYDVLVDRGFEYDSSRVPARQVDPRFEPVPSTVHAVRRWGGTLLEVPVSTADVLVMRVAVGTTGSVRNLPMPVWSSLVGARAERGEPLVMHLRASELRAGRSLLARRQATDRRALARMGRIVGQFPFTSVAQALPELMRRAPIVEA